jgi:Family of unknown function (DUF6158)
MTNKMGVPVQELSDDELERQGVRAHTTRHWVFLHGTAEQFRTHTQRMLELEDEYLRRHPQRTWQGSGGGDGAAVAPARDARIRDLVQTLTAEVLSLLGDTPATATSAADPAAEEAELLTAFAAAPDGRLHKLAAHQVARRMGARPDAVASLYKHDPPLLQAEGDARVITDYGRAWLVEHRPT